MGAITGILAIPLFYLLPICLVLFNKRFSKKQKLVGVIVSFFFSWFGFIAFYILAVLTPPPSARQSPEQSA